MCMCVSLGFVGSSVIKRCSVDKAQLAIKVRRGPMRKFRAGMPTHAPKRPGFLHHSYS